MKKNIQLWVVVLASLHYSCTASRAVVDPDYGLKAHYPSISHAAISSEDTLTDLSHPLTLIDLVDLALRYNPSTTKTWARTKTAAANWAQAQSADFPVLSGSYEVSRTKEIVGTSSSSNEPVAIESSSSTLWSPQLQLTYTLLDFGQTHSKIKAAKEALLGADCLHNYQIQSVICQTLLNYYAYVSQKEQLNSQEADISTAHLTQMIVEQEVQAGIKDASDLLQAKTAVLKTQMKAVEQKQNVMSAHASLLTAIGLRADCDVKFEETFTHIYEKIVTQDLSTLLNKALEKRLDLLSMKASLRSQEAKIETAKQQFLPNITYDLSAYTGKIHPGGNIGINYSSVIAFNIPLFSGFSSLNQLRKEKAMRDEYVAMVKENELTIIEEVVSSYSAVKNALEILSLAKSLEATATEQYHAAFCRYEAGVGAILDLITAQNTLASSRSECINSQARLLSLMVNLNYVTGLLEPLSWRDDQ